MKEQLRQALREVETVARAARWRRWLRRPLGYPMALLHRDVVYARRRTPLNARAQTFFGTDMRLALPSGMDIYLTGGKSHPSEIRLARYLIDVIESGDTVMDVGAHYGYFTLLAARLTGPQGRVISLEASPTTFEVLSANTATTANVQTFQMAASDRNETLDFYEFPNLYAEYNSLDVDQYRNEGWFALHPPRRTRVPALPLAELIEKENIRPTLMKVDVEGAEDRVIQGALLYLCERKVAVIMEYLANERGDAPHRAAEKALGGIGYRPHRIKSDGSLESLTDIPAYLRKARIESDNIVFARQG